ncbi:MAG TPA: response regulator, partial [Steroidobacteraceae bacterium]|nr:response regulator [Steroidobacteraceae bacterium]
GGTGLGLAIARQLVTLMRGTIDVSTRQPHGATFWFEVPYALANEPTHVRVPKLSLVGTRALVADDNAINREILVQYLKDWGVTVDAAIDGEQALTMLLAAAHSDCPYGLAILDHKMPKLDGLACVRRLRTQPSLASTRVILLSSLDLALNNPEMESLKIDESLTKPIRQSRLYAAIARVMGHDSQAQTSLVRAQPQMAESSGSLSRARVLLVEDNEVNREVALGMLNSFGCATSIATDGAQAVEMLQLGGFDAVLMDCQMPVMNGYDACGRIREYESKVGRDRTPIIALTANAMEEERERCLSAGMDGFLTKPFTMTDLRNMLAKFIKQLPPIAPLHHVEGIDATLDTHAIASIEALRSPNLLRRLVELYVERAPKLMQDGQRAVIAEDVKALATATHELKSSSANLGGERLARVCKECELAARKNDFVAASEAWALVRIELERFIAALKSLDLQATGS